MRRRYRRPLLALLMLPALLAPFLFAARPAQTQGIFADQAYSRLWERTDRIVQVAPGSRSWFWGPQAGAIKTERYQQSGSGTRLVQYFDKARMEINNPAGDRTSEWFVTTGLLTVEMVTGNVQVGDGQFVPRDPADLPVAGDANDANAPTYASFRSVASIVGNDGRAESRVGGPVTTTLNRAGQVGDNPGKAGDTNSIIVAYNDVLGHNIPRAIWEFMNQGGPVLENGAITNVRPITNWIFTMGYPITEPYWATVQADGKPLDVLIQLFERRALVYIPSYQPPWNVQMANVGAQYYQWIYNEPLPPAQNTPTITPTPQVPPTNTALPPTQTPLPPTATVTSLPPTAVPTTPVPATAAPVTTRPAGQIPPSVSGSVNPTQGPAGTVFNYQLTGFRPVEGVTAQFTDPAGRSFDSGLDRVSSQSGELSGVVDSSGFTEGLWGITFTGSTSKHQSIIYFYVGAPPTVPPTLAPTRAPTLPSTATRTAAPGQPTATTAPATGPTTTPLPGATLSVSPAEGSRTTQFTFTGNGFTAGEKVDYWFIDPSNRYWYPSPGRQLTASSSGGIGFQVAPNDAFYDVPTGAWSFNVIGRTSGKGTKVNFTVR